MHHLGTALIWATLVLFFSSLVMADPPTKPPPYPAPPQQMPPIGGKFCGKFATADNDDAGHLITEMMDLLKGKADCTTPARTCRRHACLNTSGIYVCNDNYYDIQLSCPRHVGVIAAGLKEDCCFPHEDMLSMGWGISGQQFVDDLGYNVIIAYGNCNHGIDSDYPRMGPPSDPWGPNGDCKN